MELLIGGQWTAAQSGREEEVTSPFDGAVVGSVPVAGAADVDAALTAAVAGAKVWRNTPGHERMRILLAGGDAGRRARRGHRADDLRRGRQEHHRGAGRGVAVG